jgi:hypothetical protein
MTKQLEVRVRGIKDALPVLVGRPPAGSRRGATTSFECLFPASPFHPEERAARNRASAEARRQARGPARPAQRGPRGRRPRGRQHRRPTDAAQLRSAALTVLSHIVATVLKDGLLAPELPRRRRPGRRPHLRPDRRETGPGGARPSCGPTPSRCWRCAARPCAPRIRSRPRRSCAAFGAPPRPTPSSPARGASPSTPPPSSRPASSSCCRPSTGFTKVPPPSDAPASPNAWGGGYRCSRPPSPAPQGQEILVFARRPRRATRTTRWATSTSPACSSAATPTSAPSTCGPRWSRSAGGYKLMMNCQCAGLTTRFAISRMFPDADIYSSWDSTYFSTGANDESSPARASTASWRPPGMAAGEDFGPSTPAAQGPVAPQAEPHARVRAVHRPRHPLVVVATRTSTATARPTTTTASSTSASSRSPRRSATPRPRASPGVAASQIGGAAARGLNWAAGSLNRVAQYSELWDSLPGQAENFYVFPPPASTAPPTRPATSPPASRPRPAPRGRPRPRPRRRPLHPGRHAAPQGGALTPSAPRSCCCHACWPTAPRSSSACSSRPTRTGGRRPRLPRRRRPARAHPRRPACRPPAPPRRSARVPRRPEPARRPVGAWPSTCWPCPASRARLVRRCIDDVDHDGGFVDGNYYGASDTAVTDSITGMPTTGGRLGVRAVRVPEGACAATARSSRRGGVRRRGQRRRATAGARRTACRRGRAAATAW